MKIRGTVLPMRAILLSSILLTGISAFAAQEAAPQNWPDNRYEAMSDPERWPFAVATPKEEKPVEEPKASFTAGWFLHGITTVTDDNGVQRDFVAIASQDRRESLILVSGDEPNKDGISIVSVERSPERGKSSVTLKKGSEYGKVEYNQMELQSNSPQAMPQPMPMGNNPGMPNRPQSGIPMPGAAVNAVGNSQLPNGGRIQIPRPAIPSPTTPGGVQIPRPANNYAPGANNYAPGAVRYPTSGAQQQPSGQPGEPRRKIRVINSKP